MKNPFNLLLPPLLLLLAIMGIAVTAVKLTDEQARDATRKLTVQQAQWRDMQSRVHKSAVEKELIARYLPAYHQLGARGFVGDEQRINWLDALHHANQKGALFGIHYEIAAQQPYTYIATPAPSQITAMQSLMRLRFPLLHEADLPTFLETLAAQNAGVFIVNQCTVRRTSSGAIQTTHFQPQLNAECQLAWITAKSAAAAASPSP